MMSRDERRFKMADQNSDMQADKEEFTAFLHPEEYDHMKDIVVLVRDKRTLTPLLKDGNTYFTLLFTAVLSFRPVGNHGGH